MSIAQVQLPLADNQELRGRPIPQPVQPKVTSTTKPSVEFKGVDPSSKPQEHNDDRPALCSCCAKSQSQTAFAIVCSRRTYLCRTCGDDCCTVNATTRQASCWHDPTHPVILTWKCMTRNCRATAATKDLVVLEDAVPYIDIVAGSGSACCGRSADCTLHRFKASCGHILCGACLIKASSKYLQRSEHPADADAKTLARNRIASEFVADRDSFLVPPCPICASCMVDEPGAFGLHTLRMLPKDKFRIAKTLANLSFHLRDS